MQLFEFGDRYRGNYDFSIAEVRSFYASVSGYRDELLWAAFWLHRATGKEEFLRYAVDKADCFGGVGWAMTEFSWDVKYAGLQVLASKVRRHSLFLLVHSSFTVVRRIRFHHKYDDPFLVDQ